MIHLVINGDNTPDSNLYVKIKRVIQDVTEGLDELIFSLKQWIYGQNSDD